MASGYRAFGVKEAQRANLEVAKYLQSPLLTMQVGDNIAGEVILNIRKKWGNSDGSKQMQQSIRSEPEGRGRTFVYTDGSIAPMGAVRLGSGITIIRAFKSPFRDKKTGQPLLFIPKVKGFRPGQWKQGIRGVHFSLVPSVAQQGSGILENTIRTRLKGGGSRPNINEVTGLNISNIYEKNSFK